LQRGSRHPRGNTLKLTQFRGHLILVIEGSLGIVINEVSERGIRAKLPVTATAMAPNGFLHAGAVVTLADTSASYGCIANLPSGTNAFTTVELKSNHLGTARDGTVECLATAVHMGRTTQVWDAVAAHRESGKTIALLRCTQMLLYQRAAG
jgi:1,4-dihydroxy-2-naphthoyl-CoA hydrolase